MLIIGCPGSGKSRLARRLAAVSGLPAVHLDRHYWGADWTEPSREAWRARLAGLMAAPRWIMDGNYGDTLTLRLAAADTVIFLDFPRSLCLWRVVCRALLWFGRQRGQDMAPGCRERLDPTFLRYVWHFNSGPRERDLRALAGFAGRTLILRSNREVAAFIAGVQRDA